MKKKLFSFNSQSNIKSQLVLGIFFLFGAFQVVKAQPNGSPCLVSSYSLSTGNAKTWPTSALANGQQDPFWQVVDRSLVFGGTSGLPMLAKLAHLPGYWGTTAGMWLSDSSNHANPGIHADSGTYITFRRSFRICGSGEVSFSVQILNDNYIHSIAIDGVPLVGASYNQIATASTSPTNTTLLWAVPTFGKLLTTGTHTLDIKVAETYSPNFNPIGFSLKGTMSSTNNIIVNDYSSPCNTFECTTSIVEAANSGNVLSELYQNSPNPFGKETSIGYNIVGMQHDAFVVVYDISAKELYKHQITEPGRGSVTLEGDKLTPGTYLYSLIVDGGTIATKRMVVTK